MICIDYFGVFYNFVKIFSKTMTKVTYKGADI